MVILRDYFFRAATGNDQLADRIFNLNKTVIDLVYKVINIFL